MKDIPRPEHPRPDLRRADPWWRNLNGTWEFEIDRSASGLARGRAEGRPLGQEIVVPFCPESRLSGVGDRDFLNCVWYRRRLEVPTRWEGRRVLLHIGACDYRTDAWLNGMHLGQHEGGYTPVTFELTDALGAGGTGELVVRALDDTRREGIPRGKQSPRYESFGCHYTRTTGIWQTVWIEAVPRTYVRRLAVWPDLRSGRFLVQVHVEGPDEAQGTVRLLAEGAVVGRARFRCAGSGRVDVVVEPEEARPWSPQDPFLYELGVELQGPGGRDEVTSWAGLREFRTEGNRFLLNGKPIFLRAVLDQGFYPRGIYTAPTLEDLRRDIEVPLSMGFNGARLHQKLFEPAFLHLCDRLGYLVFGEFADWGRAYDVPEFAQRIIPQWREAMLRDLGHPSIIGWCPLNEARAAGYQRYGEWTVRELHRQTRALDPTRPAIDASGYFHYESDIWDCHNYEQDPAKFAAAYAPLAEGRPEDAYTNVPEQMPYRGERPYFVSEFGGIWWDPEGAEEARWGYGERPGSEEEFLKRFDALVGVLLENPGVAGFCYTQLTDVEQEVNGLMTYGRELKFSPGRIARSVARPAAIEGE